MDLIMVDETLGIGKGKSKGIITTTIWDFFMSKYCEYEDLKARSKRYFFDEKLLIFLRDNCSTMR
jgi:hypothetical protein